MLLQYHSRNNVSIANDIYDVNTFKVLDTEIELAMSKNMGSNPSKILIFCHSVTGSYYEFANVFKRLISDGYGVISYSRKGHNSIKCDTINIVGCPNTLDKIIGYISSEFEASKLYLVGVSAGTSLIATYLGNSNMLYRNRISKAALFSAGYHFEESMLKLSWFAKLLCFVNMFIFFLGHNLRNSNVELLKFSKGFDHFVFNIWKQLGYKHQSDYFRDHDPKWYIHKISTPCLFVNSLDDFVFHGDIITPIIDTILYKTNFTFKLYKYGGHICFFKDFRGNTLIYDHIIEMLGPINT